MSYVQQNLLPNETVSFQTKLHWIAVAIPTAWLLLGLLLAISDGEFLRVVGILLILGGLIGVLSNLAKMESSEFAVTDRRVLIKVGILRRHSLELLLSKVEGIGVDQGLLGRMLGYGTIVVSGTGGTKEIFAGITDPLKFRREVQQRVPV